MDRTEVIRVEGLSKKYSRNLKKALWYSFSDINKKIFGKKLKKDTLRTSEFWAIEDLSFELKKGECLGLIGKNGAGKSTLLKLLSGLVQPDKGKITISGKLGALIELGAGFNPILTGRENIYINASILGFSKSEIDDMLEDIIDFSELREFIDTPVQFYSSGMKVRLGFAVAVNIQPDVLILDEVLAVGDAGFKIKSFNRISQLIESTAVIMVSHNMSNISRICNKALVLNRGKSVYYGSDVAQGIEKYYDMYEGGTKRIEFEKGVKLTDIRLNDQRSEPDHLPTIQYGSSPVLSMSFEIENKNREFDYILQITDRDMKVVGQFFSNLREGMPALTVENPSINLRFNSLNLVNGTYNITIFIAEHTSSTSYNFAAVYRHFFEFKITGLDHYTSAPVHLEAEAI